MLKRLLQIGGVAVGALAFGVVGWWLYVDYQVSPRSWPVEEFSSARWKDAPPEQRFVFYRDLADSGRLEGATKQDVVELLGPPGFEDPAGTYMTYVVKYREPDEWSFNSLYILDIKLDPATSEVCDYLIRGD